MQKTISTFLVAAAGSLCTILVYNYVQPNKPAFQSQSNQIIPAPKYANLSGNAAFSGNTDFRNAAESSIHSVVHIKTKTEQNIFYNDPFQQFFFGGQPQAQIQQGYGSGVIISGDGYIVTNNHVVAEANEIEVVLNNKKSYTGKVIGKDPNTDLALLKIDATDLPYMTYGNSNDTKIGDWVLAVGNPFNLTSTVTAGIVSAKGRDLSMGNRSGRQLESYIQTDAAVNPGNSGGALVNTQGQMVGINTAIVAPNTGSYTGYSFAIPVNIVKKVVADIIEFGVVKRAVLGVNIANIDNDLAKEKKLNTYNGAYVAAVMEDGAADNAGVKEGDVITKIGEIEIKNTNELNEQVSRSRPGDELAITVMRNGKEMNFKLNLKDMQGNGKSALTKKMNDKNTNTQSGSSMKILGSTFTESSKEELEALNLKNGVKISNVGTGKLAVAGIKNGFIVTKIDKQTIENVEQLADILNNKSGGLLIEGTYPNGTKAYYGFGL
jgi:serine protease Do